jgi:hypothetical protein
MINSATCGASIMRHLGWPGYRSAHPGYALSVSLSPAISKQAHKGKSNASQTSDAKQASGAKKPHCDVSSRLTIISLTIAASANARLGPPDRFSVCAPWLPTPRGVCLASALPMEVCFGSKSRVLAPQRFGSKGRLSRVVKTPATRDQRVCRSPLLRRLLRIRMRPLRLLQRSLRLDRGIAISSGQL